MTRGSRIALGVLGAVIIALLAFQTPLMSNMRSWAWTAFVSTAGRMAGIGPLEIDNNTLAQMEKLKLENVRLNTELADYRILREQLKSPAAEGWLPIQAVVIARPVDAFRTELILNKGRKDGIKENSPVVVNGSILAGFITAVQDDTSVLRLLLNPETSLPVEVANEERPSGLLKGRQYTSLHLEMVPRDMSMAAGQDVVSKGGTEAPAGLVAGRVGEVQKKESEAYQEANLILPYEPEELRAVTILQLP